LLSSYVLHSNPSNEPLEIAPAHFLDAFPQAKRFAIPFLSFKAWLPVASCVTVRENNNTPAQFPTSAPRFFEGFPFIGESCLQRPRFGIVITLRPRRYSGTGFFPPL